MKIFILSIIILFTSSCTETSRVFVEMNRNIKKGVKYSPSEFMEKAEYFTNAGDYYSAVYVINHKLFPIYSKSNDSEGLKKSYGLLCKIFNHDRDSGKNSPINRFYSPEAAKVACKEAGIKQ